MRGKDEFVLPLPPNDVPKNPLFEESLLWSVLVSLCSVVDASLGMSSTELRLLGDTKRLRLRSGWFCAASACLFAIAKIKDSQIAQRQTSIHLPSLFGSLAVEHYYQTDCWLPSGKHIRLLASVWSEESHGEQARRGKENGPRSVNTASLQASS